MKKLLFVLAFAFIGGQVFTQSYMVVVYKDDDFCSNLRMMSINNLGNIVNDTCLFEYPSATFPAINKELNSIMALGYKLTHISSKSNINDGGGGMINSYENLTQGGYIDKINSTVYILSIP